MTANWVALLTVIALLVLGVIGYRRQTRRLLTAYGEEFRAYNENAFEEIVEPSPDDRFQFITRLAWEVQSSKGQTAIVVRSIGGRAIHHLNRSGTFSAKGPYFISSYSHNWRSTGRTHLVKTVRSKGGVGFKPDHYKQSGIIWEKGLAVLEYETRKYPPIDIRDFARLMNRRTGK